MGQIWEIYVYECGTVLGANLGQLRDFTVRDNVGSQRWDKRVSNNVPMNISESILVPIFYQSCPKMFQLQSKFFTYLSQCFPIAALKSVKYRNLFGTTLGLISVPIVVPKLSQYSPHSFPYFTHSSQCGPIAAPKSVKYRNLFGTTLRLISVPIVVPKPSQYSSHSFTYFTYLSQYGPIIP